MRLPDVLRRIRPIDAVAALYATAFFAWLSIRTPGTAATQAIGEAAFYPLGLLVAWASWRNSRLPGLDARTRIAWQLLTLSFLCLWVSGTAWEIYRIPFGPESWPAWVDDLQTLHHVVSIAAFLAFPGRAFRGRARTRFLLDAALVLVAGAVVATYFGFRLWLHELEGESLWTAVTGPGLDWLVLVAAAVGALGKRDAATRRVLSLMVFAASSYVVANYYFTVAQYGAEGLAYRSGDAVDGLWFAAWVLRWLSVRSFWYASQSGRESVAADNDPAAVQYAGARFAYLVAAGCFGVLVEAFRHPDPPLVGLLAGSAITMIAVLLARQLIELRESKRLFEAQVEQETRFRCLVEQSSDAVLIVDANGLVTYASSTAGTILGAVGVGTRLLDMVRDDDRAALVPVLTGDANSGRLLMHVPRNEGSWREIEAVWTNQRADPAVNGIVINCRDVTEQRELEQQLRHGQKLDAVGQLAGGLAHDVNNSLAVVRGYAELLKDQFDPGSGAAGDLAHVEQAVDRAASITSKVLAFSRRQVARPTVLDLTEVVRELLPMLRQTVSPRVDVRLDLEEAIWPVRADRGQIEQVLVNLAANARDAMPRGGSLSITTANRPGAGASPPPAGSPAGDCVALAVGDEGVGMTPGVGNGSSNRSSPPRQARGEWDSAWPWCTGSSRKPGAVSSSTRRLDMDRRSRSSCPGRSPACRRTRPRGPRMLDAPAERSSSSTTRTTCGSSPSGCSSATATACSMRRAPSKRWTSSRTPAWPSTCCSPISSCPAWTAGS